MDINIVEKMVYGAIIGDCLGVPVEFTDRQTLRENPVTDMIGHGTYCKPKGTWSDDSSLLLAQMDGLKYPVDRKKIAQNFVDWKIKDKYCQKSLFDIGNTTSRAIAQINLDICNNTFSEDKSYCTEVFSSGNGALMRILPIVFICVQYNLDFNQRKKLVYNMASLTHGNEVSKISCLIYIEILYYLFCGYNKEILFEIIKEELGDINSEFDRIFDDKFLKTKERYIQSDGYCVHTLEAAIWCVFNSDSYDEAVLRAVNLGEDTDTTACVAGGLAALYFKEINDEWKNIIYKNEIIDNIIERFGVENGIIS